MIRTYPTRCTSLSLASFLRRPATERSRCSLCLANSFWISASTEASPVWRATVKIKNYSQVFRIHDKRLRVTDTRRKTDEGKILYLKTNRVRKPSCVLIWHWNPHDQYIRKTTTKSMVNSENRTNWLTDRKVLGEWITVKANNKYNMNQCSLGMLVQHGVCSGWGCKL